ncbi:MAG: hypothetical protein B5M56_04405 [Desulfococcus sp. 4484_241]|nr:MAG: hypothetical protein B5M56_04405 [Desulfococcus sp. 4484_241]
MPKPGNDTKTPRYLKAKKRKNVDLSGGAEVGPGSSADGTLASGPARPGFRVHRQRAPIVSSRIGKRGQKVK